MTLTKEQMLDLMYPGAKNKPKFSPVYHPLGSRPSEALYHCWMCGDYKPIEEMGDVACLECEGGDKCRRIMAHLN